MNLKVTQTQVVQVQVIASTLMIVLIVIMSLKVVLVTCKKPDHMSLCRLVLPHLCLFINRNAPAFAAEVAIVAI